MSPLTFPQNHDEIVWASIETKRPMQVAHVAHESGVGSPLVGSGKLQEGWWCHKSSDLLIVVLIFRSMMESDNLHEEVLIFTPSKA